MLFLFAFFCILPRFWLLGFLASWLLGLLASWLLALWLLGFLAFRLLVGLCGVWWILALAFRILCFPSSSPGFLALHPVIVCWLWLPASSA